MRLLDKIFLRAENNNWGKATKPPLHNTGSPCVISPLSAMSLATTQQVILSSHSHAAKLLMNEFYENRNYFWF